MAAIVRAKRLELAGMSGSAGDCFEFVRHNGASLSDGGWQIADGKSTKLAIQSAIRRLPSAIRIPHNGSQYENFTMNTSVDGAFGSADMSRRKLKSPIGATS